MRKAKRWYVLFVLMLIIIYDCAEEPPKDELTLEVDSWDTITYVAIETLKTRVNCYTFYKDNANYRVYFEGIDSWGQIKFTSFVENINNMAYGVLYKIQLKWFGLAPSGNYTLRIHFKKMTGTKLDQAKDSVYAQVGPASLIDTSEYTLIRWCGDKRYGNMNDTLKEPAAYPIFVRVINKSTGIGINNKYVSFTTSAGALTKSDDWTDNYTVPYGGEWLDGLAWTNLILPTGIGNYTVTAVCGDSAVTFDLMCVSDGDTTANDTLKIHERWGDTLSRQIAGDGYWGINDPNSYVKNLKLEVDYDASVISLTTLQKTLNLVRDSLYPQVGIAISYVIDNTFSSGYITRSMEKQLLAGNRNSAYKGIGVGYVHIMFASMFEQDSVYLCGRAVTYRDTAWENVGGSTCAYYGSGNLSATGHSQYYLDSVGCMIYVKPSCRYIPSTFIDSSHVLALITAHEVGHAIGLGHLPHTTVDSLKGVMSAKFNISSSMSYGQYARFEKPRKHDYDNRWLINLKKILGRETVDFMW